MPAKAMMYKFLNTFIDDLFAFTIKMPLLHRLATLRDDVIFFVYLYQGWKYKVDYSRVNEFGQGGEEEVTDEKEVVGKKASRPLVAESEGDTGKEAAVKEGVVKDVANGAVSSGKESGSVKKRKA